MISVNHRELPRGYTKEGAMGNWWGAIHFKTTDRGLVRNAVSDLAVMRDIKCLLGPEINGWVSVYPQDNGQDTSIAEALAIATKLDVFHLLLCDDDVFAYNFFHDGKLVDEYTSKPGYFSESTREAEEKMSGNPDRYAHLLLKPIEAARQLLMRFPPGQSGAFDAMAQFEDFAQLVGIENAGTSYEYLDQGEREGIKRWREFERFPDPKLEKNAQKREIDELKLRGQLLAAYPGKKSESANWCLDPLRNGFLLTWLKVPAFTGSGMFQIAAPWPARPKTLAISLSGGLTNLTTSGDGQWLALQTQQAMDVQTELWNLETLEKVRDLPRTMRMKFSADGQYLAQIDQEQVRVISIPSGEVGRVIEGAQFADAAFHPSNDFLLVNQATAMLLVDLKNEGPPKFVYVGGISDAWKERIASGSRPFDVEARSKQTRANMQEGLKALAKMMGRKGGIPADAILERPPEEEEKLIQQMVEHERKAHEFRLKPEAAERVHIAHWSDDGRLLFCGTDKGIRVYEWSHVRDGGEELTSALHLFDPPTDMAAGWLNGSIHSIAHDMRRNRVLFGGPEGVVRTMDLATGEVGVLFELPQRPWVRQLAITPDGAALGCLGFPSVRQTRSGETQCLFVWNLS